MTTKTRKTPSRNGAAPAGDNGRTADGKFSFGNVAGRGNPVHRALAARRKAVIDAVGPEDVAKVARTLFEMATEGRDVAAARVLFEYCIGKPAAPVDPDDCDMDEFRRLLESPDVEQTCRRGQVTPALAVREVLRGLVSTPQGLLEALEEKFQELREDLQRRAPPGEWLELEDIARDAGLGGDDDEDE